MASITSKVKSKPRNKTPAKESSEPKQLVINALKGFSVGTVFLFIFLSAFSFIMVKFDYAEKSVPIMALASALLAALFAGYWAAKCYKKKGL
ncbi:MAG: TIGR04086 family membrane protein, partial [Oscillospiraceae bacterium]